MEYFFKPLKQYIFAVEKNIRLRMQKTNKRKAETDKESFLADSENLIENVKYIKKLELQRTVLNKLVGPEINTAMDKGGGDQENFDSN
jgi:hypothetical protein